LWKIATSIPEEFLEGQAIDSINFLEHITRVSNFFPATISGAG